MVRKVVAYTWDDDEGGTIEVPRQAWWPDCVIITDELGRRWCLVDWDAAPYPRSPDGERLACGHYLPVRTQSRGKQKGQAWFKPGRMCILCANGVPVQQP